MKTIDFKCKLLSDIIINQKAATEGNNTTLDFIPGANFLGISASELYNKLNPEISYKIYHSNSVRFSDGHPFDAEKNIRALKIPLSYYYDKYNSDNIYFWQNTHGIANIQLKQFRSGFYYFDEEKQDAIKVNERKNFSIKSAYDSEKRRSKDEMMFGYESLEKGSLWHFSLFVDDKNISDTEIKQLIDSLCGVKRIGRSRSAQYGLVEIEQLKNPVSPGRKIKLGKNHYLYAESRIIIIDKNGQPVFTPEGQDLGFEGYRVCYEKSQIRTFQYAPYNSVRKSRDCDRVGIEKGSVICLEKIEDLPEEAPSINDALFIGSYQNEGFGKILADQSFITNNKEGRPSFKLIAGSLSPSESSANRTTVLINSNLVAFLQKRKNIVEKKINANKIAGDFINENYNRFRDQSFASQWGTIRKMTLRTESLSSLKSELFDETKGYLEHGVAKEKWQKGGRKELIVNLLNKIDEDNYKLIVVNIASEIAKKIKR